MMRRRAQRGQALAEMLITFAWGVPLLLAILQLGLMYRAKATLNDATFRAARAGSLHNAFTSDMKQELVRGMLPTMYAAPPGESPNLATYTARREALGRLYGVDAHPIAKVEVISPTAAGFESQSWGRPDYTEGMRFHPSQTGPAPCFGSRETYPAMLDAMNSSQSVIAS